MVRFLLPDVSIPEVEFLSLLQPAPARLGVPRRRVSIPEVEFLSLLHDLVYIATANHPLLVSIPEVEFLSLLLNVFPLRLIIIPLFQFQKWNSSACSLLGGEF